MLRNIILDMGNVLIRYEPSHFVACCGIECAEDRQLLLNEIFLSADWPLLDMGLLNENELEHRVLNRLPNRLHEIAHQLIFHWSEPIEPIPGIAEFLKDCKSAGLRLYLLSNASFRQPDYWQNVPGNELFDGVMISAFEGCAKPSTEIYLRLLERFHLSAEECFFVDDVENNILAATAVGIHGFQFSGNVDALRKAIQRLLPIGIDLHSSESL